MLSAVKMSFKSLLIIFLLQYTLYTDAKAQTNFFRKDYTFIEETQNFYRFSTISKSWLEALTTCAREGSELFYAKDQRELDARFMATIWTQPRDFIYIGLSSFLSRGVFMTPDASTSIQDVYHNWAPGEPNNNKGEENCIQMSKTGVMYDIDCERRLPFICRKTLASLEWHDDCQTPYKDYIVNEDLGRCYKFFSTPMNWMEAFATCNAEESYLAIINSKEEAKHLVNMTEQAPKHEVRGKYLTGVVMLGFYNRFKRGWLSVKGSTLEDSGYSKWGSPQPDEDKNLCGLMFYNGELTYGDCSQRSFFICEKELKFEIDVRAGIDKM